MFVGNLPLSLHIYARTVAKQYAGRSGRKSFLVPGRYNGYVFGLLLLIAGGIFLAVVKNKKEVTSK